ncbi:hypothetical protein PCE1_002823 [Barthelona sp. PCE]
METCRATIESEIESMSIIDSTLSIDLSTTNSEICTGFVVQNASGLIFNLKLGFTENYPSEAAILKNISCSFIENDEEMMETVRTTVEERISWSSGCVLMSVYSFLANEIHDQLNFDALITPDAYSGFFDEKKVEEIQEQNDPTECPFPLYRTEIYTEMKSTFQTLVVPIQTVVESEIFMDWLMHFKEFQNSTHNMQAGRLFNAETNDYETWTDEDGEKGAGGSLNVAIEFGGYYNCFCVVARC